MKKSMLVLLCMMILSFGLLLSCSDTTESEVPTEPVVQEIKGEDKLVILWTSADREVALMMGFMYASNSKNFGWWDDITLVVWGPSAKLLSEDKELQDYVKRMLASGITVKACKSCADSYGVSSQLRDLGITVKLMSELTDYLKEGRKILTI